jgi:Glycosyl hydrolases family 31/Galactose mutarotase-like
LAALLREMLSSKSLLAAALTASGLLLSASPAEAVDRSKFRTCNDAGFCKRHRSKAAEPEVRIREGTVSLDAGSSKLKAVVDVVGAPHLELAVHFYDSGIARIRLTESDTSKPPRWEVSQTALVGGSPTSFAAVTCHFPFLFLLQSPDVILPSGTKGASAVELIDGSSPLVAAIVSSKKGAATFVSYTNGNGQKYLLVLYHHPFRAEIFHFSADGKSVDVANGPLIAVNDRGLSYFEHRRLKGEGSSQLAAAAAAAAGADSHGDPSNPHAHKKIVDWGEDGKPIYEDGTHGDGGSDLAHSAGDQPGNEDAAGADVVAAASVDADQPGMWEETFQTHHDSKPFGPTSVGVDITFPSATHVYGIPEHASTHALRATDGSENPTTGTQEYNGQHPYRLYNLDVFEYELDNPMALYGSIPFMLAHGPNGNTAGVYWNNPTETYVDVNKGLKGEHTPTGSKMGVGTRWISESGLWDLSLAPGISSAASSGNVNPAKAVLTQYTKLTGTQSLPPLFALGYHQCRWNYKDEADVYAVDSKFEEYSFPYDVIWLDIEHTDGKRYFTWDDRLFPNPAAMQDKLAARGHKMVTIIDPHIKKDGNYKIHSEAVSKGLYIKNSKGEDYDGWCWPGSSGYLDFTSPKVREWWADQFQLSNYKGSTLSLYTWNDMNGGLINSLRLFTAALLLIMMIVCCFLFPLCRALGVQWPRSVDEQGRKVAGRGRTPRVAQPVWLLPTDGDGRGAD